MKTIWIINQFAGTPESGWGERHFYFAKYWQSKGIDVRIISGSFNHVFSKTVEVNGLYQEQIYDGIKFYWVRTPKYKATSMKRFYSMLVFAYRVLKLPIVKLGKPEIILVSSMPIFPIWSGIRLSKKYAAKLIFEIRDIWPLTLQLLGNKSANHPAVKFIGWFEKLGYRKSHEIVSLLPNAQSHIENIAKKPVSFSYIPNGIDSSLLKGEDAPNDLINAIPNEKFVVGYAGTIGLANALEFLIDASIKMVDLENIHFVIVGDGYLKTTLIEKTASNRNITFWPKIKKNQVQDLLANFDICFVGRNDTELFKHGVSANKYFDYMLAGKPILDSNNFIKDPVELSGCGIIVRPDSSDAIVEGIHLLKNMTEAERKEMGLRGQRFVKEHHSIQQLANQYIQLF